MLADQSEKRVRSESRNPRGIGKVGGLAFGSLGEPFENEMVEKNGVEDFMDDGGDRLVDLDFQGLGMQRIVDEGAPEGFGGQVGVQTGDRTGAQGRVVLEHVDEQHEVRVFELLRVPMEKVE